MVESDVALTIRAVIDSFEIYTINSLIENKNFKTDFIMSIALFWVAQPIKKNLIIFLPTSLK